MCARSPTARSSARANGTLVSITEYKDDANGKPWVDVADYKTKKVIGWVFREFVSCY